MSFVYVLVFVANNEGPVWMLELNTYGTLESCGAAAEASYNEKKKISKFAALTVRGLYRCIPKPLN